jgi:general secretion pathway protein G
VDLFRIDTGRLPTQAEGLEVLIRAPADASEWLGPYIAKGRVPLDPWGREYRYALDAAGEAYAVISYGADGVEGGEGNGRDLRSDQDGRAGAQTAAKAGAL